MTNNHELAVGDVQLSSDNEAKEGLQPADRKIKFFGISGAYFSSRIFKNLARAFDARGYEFITAELHADEHTTTIRQDVERAANCIPHTVDYDVYGIAFSRGFQTFLHLPPYLKKYDAKHGTNKFESLKGVMALNSAGPHDYDIGNRKKYTPLMEEGKLLLPPKQSKLAEFRLDYAVQVFGSDLTPSEQVVMLTTMGVQREADRGIGVPDWTLPITVVQCEDDEALVLETASWVWYDWLGIGTNYIPGTHTGVLINRYNLVADVAIDSMLDARQSAAN